MQRGTMPPFVSWLLLLPCLLAMAPVAAAADFRIETRVYASGDKEPANESVTLFSSGVAYDFNDRGHRVTIFRPGVADKPGRFVLLDTEREIRTEIGADQVAIVMTKLRRWAALHEDAWLRFLGDPVFEESFDTATGELRLTSDRLSYRLVTMPVVDERTMDEITAFLDAFAQLQTLLEAGLPPTPRLRLNAALGKRDVVPVEVERYEGPISGEPELRAEHLITWILSKHDRARIDRVTEQLTEFADAPNSAFSQKRPSAVAQQGAP